MAARAPIKRTHRVTAGSLAAVTCAAVLLAGCDSGAISGPGAGGGDGHGGTAANGDRGNDGNGRGGHRYGFGLPEGPTTGNPPAIVYMDIREGKCGAAQHYLNEMIGSDTLLEIGIALCRGDRRTARARLGTYRPGAGLFTDQKHWFLCELYRAAKSVVDQRPRSAFGTCPAPPAESPAPSPSEPVSPDQTVTPDQSVTPSESPVVPTEPPDQASPQASG